MDKKLLQAILKKAREASSKRGFNQSIDFIVTFRGLDLKKPAHQLDFFGSLHYSSGKPVRIGGLVGGELKEQSEKVFDKTVMADDFQTIAKDKRQVKKLANSVDYFVAQANVMTKVAQHFGRILGPKGKMPNPKAGCAVPPNANLAALKEKLQKTFRVSVKTQPMYQLRVGLEDQNEDEVIDNILTVYNAIIHHTINEKNNIKAMYLKTTMGKPVKVESEA